MANVAADQGDISNSRSMHEKALALAQQIGAQNDIAGALINLGNLLGNSGKLEESNKQYREALSVAQAAGDNSDALLAETNLAANLMSQGDFAAARQQFESSLKTAQVLGDKRAALEAQINLSMIAAAQGQLDQARTGFEGALEESQKMGLKSDEATALAALGDVSLAEDDLALAGKRYQQALAVRTQLGDKLAMASLNVSLASLALEQNGAPQAESLARAALQEFQAEKLPDQEAGAHDVLAQALLSQHKIDEAVAEVAAARALAANDQPTLLSLAITEARVTAAKGSPAEAIKKLLGVSQRAKGAGLVPYELQARLAIGQIQVASGADEQARAALQSLSRDAKQQRYKLIARTADALLLAKHGR